MKRFLIALMLATAARSQVINAASCSSTDVRAAFNTVTNSTTTINIPAGTCHWAAADRLTQPSASTTLSVLGAGNLTTSGGGDATVIIDDYPSTNPLLQIVTAGTSSAFRLAGITFQGGTGSVKQGGVVSVDGNSHNVRIDHSHFNLSTYGPSGEIGIRTIGWINGVIDHNVFDDRCGVCEGVNIWSVSYNGGTLGNGAWATNTSFGTSDFVYVETNTFNDGLYADDCDAGGKEVFRFNTVNRAQTQTHPTGSSPDLRGCRAKETYQNALNGNADCNGSAGFGNCLFNVFFLSSGPNLFWGNTAPVVNAGAGSGYQWLISIHSMRRDSQTYPEAAPPNGWGYCGTSFNGKGSNWDQNTSGNTGYPCLDQPGQGKGDLLTGDFPSMTNSTTGTVAWPHQALEPVYEWLDTLTPVPNNPGGVLNNYNPDVLVSGRDFYTNNANFTGTSGVGSGLLSGRPATCVTGVAYWATDQGTWNRSGSGGQGVLYKCTATNTWTLYYTPYTYPHPLVGPSNAGAIILPPSVLTTQ